MSQAQRKLAAIMFTDVAGYTALGQRNESLSLALVDEQRRLIRPILKKHSGREVKTIGDAFLVEFPNALDAVRCAYDIQRSAREFNISLPEEQRLHLRIGLHLGDVMVSRGDIEGDAVNVASRIESLSEDGGVCMTRQVFDHVRNKFGLPLKSVGTRSLKNVSEPLEVFKIEFPWTTAQENTTHLDSSRVAVLPFANMSPDPNDVYFADGITEEVISTLSEVSGLSVISRTSVIGYKGSTKRVKEIGQELEVGSIVEGSFRKAGNKIRVTTQLIDVGSDKHIWSHSYDRNLDDVFAVQSDIAKQVADALRVKILAPEINRIDKKPTDNTMAYDLYLRGRYHWNKRHLDDVRKAIDYFQQAITIDPNFALGHTGLSDCFLVLGRNFDLDTKANHEKARAESAKALELDESLAEAHASLGLVLQTYDLKGAEKEFRKAIELKPGYAIAHQWYSTVLRAQMRLKEAFDHVNQALELDPFSQVINTNLAACYSAARDYDKALQILRKTAELDPGYAEVHYQMAAIYGSMKRFEDAEKEAKITIELYGEGFPILRKLAEVAMAYFRGDKETVRKLLPDLETNIESPGSRAFLIAGFHFFLGENDKGFEWIERSISRLEFGPLQMRSSEFFDGIRSDPRYLNLIKRLGLE